MLEKKQMLKSTPLVIPPQTLLTPDASLAATKNPHPLHNISSDSYKSSSLLEKRIRLLSEELDKISSRAKKQDVQLLHILKIRKSQENKIDEYKILLSERNKTVEALSNELAVKTLELNKNLDREDLLKSENKLLLDRLLLEKSQLAKKVNDANEYLESMNVSKRLNRLNTN
ncbi:Autophagy protein 16 [Neolecta irregularis DAH-3]|uniref:Autophagy protein 16 n=1 Tax=Neolecta irregularis (strain DAH-3) TaxID=1198029 RepID=A0A1U7LWI3_NEOID|nr:Autophagy protein 16 [Neolecta irregularis DAH-3]|eukprot:OLL27036.1 Autophagy protein 16 [Neolecta irregularis DAH-3]